MQFSIDLNCDLGELLPGNSSNYDEEIFPFISSCNIACGFHSGSPELMEKTIQLALQHQVSIGAHPSYLDRENFGRQSIKVPLPELQSQIRYQIGALKGMVEAQGGRLHHIKPHGALYNDMVKNEDLALTVIEAIASISSDLIIFGLAGSNVGVICENKQLKFGHEVFADRRYQGPIELRSRKFEDAVIHDTKEVLSQIDFFLQGKLKDVDGKIHNVKADTICLHSDTQGAVHLAKAIHSHLILKDVNIHPVS